MRNKITQIIVAGLLLVSFWGNGQSMKKYSKRMFAAKSYEERLKLHDNFMPKYNEKMHNKFPDKKEFWGWKNWIDFNLNNNEIAIEGQILDHPSAFQIKFDSASKKIIGYKSILITKIINGKNLKVGNIIQVERQTFVNLRGGGRDLNYINPSSKLILFLNKSSVNYLHSQYSDYISLVFTPSTYGVFEKDYKDRIINIELPFADFYKYLYYKHKIEIKDTFDISNPVKYNEILKKVNAKLGSNHPLKGQEINLQKSIILDTIGEGIKYHERKLQNEKSKRYVDSLHQDLLDFKLDSAKFPERKMKYRRYGKWKLPSKPINFKKSNLFFYPLLSTIKSNNLTI